MNHEIITIESDIPVPEKTHGTKGRKRGPLHQVFAALEVGDSFFLPAENPRVKQIDLARMGRMYKIKVTTRQREEGGVKGVRTWRVEA